MNTKDINYARHWIHVGGILTAYSGVHVIYSFVDSLAKARSRKRGNIDAEINLILRHMLLSDDVPVSVLQTTAAHRDLFSVSTTKDESRHVDLYPSSPKPPEIILDYLTALDNLICILMEEPAVKG